MTIFCFWVIIYESCQTQGHTTLWDLKKKVDVNGRTLNPKPTFIQLSSTKEQ
jgi:hypothetical protein